MMGFIDDFRAIKYIAKRESKDLFLYSAIFIGFLVLIHYLFFVFSASEDFAEQVQHRQQAVTRSAASNLETHFDLFGRELVTLSNREVFKSDENFDDVSKELNVFIKKWPHLVSGAIFIDQEGKLVYQSEGSENVGDNLSDRVYFNWAKTADSKEVYYSDPIIARVGLTQGKYIVPVATPVVDGEGDFAGVLVSGVLIEKLRECCASEYQSVTDSQIYVVQNDGVFIFSTEKELTGENIIDFITENPFPGNTTVVNRVKVALEEGGEGNFDLIIPKNIGGFLPLERRFITYSPINLGESQWYYALSYPYSEVLVYAKPFIIRGSIFIAISYISLLVFSVRLARLRGRQEGKVKE